MFCGLAPAQAASPPQVARLEGVTWQLTEAVLGRQRPTLLSPMPTLTFRGDRASGNSGCAPFVSPVAVKGRTLHFGPAAGPQMTCAAPAHRTQEGWYLNALRQVTRYRLSGARLILHSGKTDRLVFRAQDTNVSVPDLSGAWAVTRLSVAERAVRLLAPTSLNFSADPDHPGSALRFSGAAGCNHIFGAVSLDGPTVTFRTDGTTRMTCGPSRNAQEAALLRVLGARLTLSMADDGDVRLHGPGGELTLRRAPSPAGARDTGQAEAWDGDYRLSCLNGAPLTPAPEPLSLKLRGNALSGPDGCTTFGTTVQIGGGWVVLVGPLRTTRRPEVRATGASLTLSVPGQTQEFTRR